MRLIYKEEKKAFLGPCKASMMEQMFERVLNMPLGRNRNGATSGHIKCIQPYEHKTVFAYS